MSSVTRHALRRGPSLGSALLPLALVLVACDGRPAEPPVPVPEAPPAQPEVLAAPTPPAAPVLGFRRTVEDLGTIFDAAEQRVSFEFTNTGGTDLEIGEIKVTCGCTTTQLEKKRFAPGEGSAIEVVYKPAGSGPLRRTVGVHSNDPAQPVIELHIDARIEPFVEFDPAQVLLGDMERGKEHRIPARFRVGDPDALIVSVVSQSPQIEVSTLGMDEQGWQRIELVIGPDVPWGSYVGRVAVEVRGVVKEGGPRVAHTARLLVHGMFYDQVRANPAFLSVGLAQPDAPFRAQTELVQRNGGAFALTRLEIEGPMPAGMTVRAEPLVGARQGHLVIVEGDPQGYQGSITGTLVVETDIPDEPALRLSVVGRVGPVTPARPAGGHSH